MTSETIALGAGYLRSRGCPEALLTPELAPGEAAAVVGLAVVFDRLVSAYGPNGRRYPPVRFGPESFAPGALVGCPLWLDHRLPTGGTVREDRATDVGLWYRATIPDTDRGRWALAELLTLDRLRASMGWLPRGETPEEGCVESVLRVHEVSVLPEGACPDTLSLVAFMRLAAVEPLTAPPPWIDPLVVLEFERSARELVFASLAERSLSPVDRLTAEHLAMRLGDHFARRHAGVSSDPSQVLSIERDLEALGLEGALAVF